MNARGYGPANSSSVSAQSCLDTNLSKLIEEADRGDTPASHALFAALYRELHGLARRQLARHGGGVSLSVTTLLHEAYLDMSGRSSEKFPDSARFMGYAAKVMRGLIIDHARVRRAQKRGGHFEITSLNTDAEKAVDTRELELISAALDQLARLEPQLAEIVDLKFFCGFSFTEIAAMRGVAERTVQRQWEKARVYLYRELRSEISI